MDSAGARDFTLLTSVLASHRGTFAPGFCHLPNVNTNCGHLLPLRKSAPRKGSGRGGKERQASEKPPCLEKGKKPETRELEGPPLSNV